MKGTMVRCLVAAVAALALAFVALSPGPSPALAANETVVTSAEWRADATFVTQNGSLKRTLHVSARDFILHPISASDVTVDLTESRAGRQATSYHGRADLSQDQFLPGGFESSASLKASVRLCPNGRGACLPLSLNLTWTPTGPAASSISLAPGDGVCLVSTVRSADTRDATVSGSARWRGKNLAAGGGSGGFTNSKVEMTFTSPGCPIP